MNTVHELLSTRECCKIWVYFNDINLAENEKTTVFTNCTQFQAAVLGYIGFLDEGFYCIQLTLSL